MTILVGFAPDRDDQSGLELAATLARSGGLDLLVVTVDETGKTKRLAHTARVELRPCDVRGNVAEGAPTYAATATVHRDRASVARVKRALGAKYGWWYRALTTVDPALDRLPRRRKRAAIVLRAVVPLG